MKLDDVNLLQFGNTVQLVGAIWQGEGKTYLCMFPGEEVPRGEVRGVEFLDTSLLEMDADDWQRFLRQTDLMETEVLVQAKDGTTTKAILRKSARQIDQVVSWRVFRRDDYTCRYCGKDDAPLTVDHLVLWEEGGPSTEENMIAACKKCNRKRGNKQLAEWLTDPYFLRISEGLSASQRGALHALVPKLDSIPRMKHKRSR
jgi:hypothetical protein